MSAADRKIVHDAVHTVPGVATSSEGEEPRRYVVVKPAPSDDAVDAGDDVGAEDAEAEAEVVVAEAEVAEAEVAEAHAEAEVAEADAILSADATD